ncbi:hypothetical protein EYZ11_012048 [Aspergillus tanneri]|uniref:SET domain-containing protein n=1 Tax=Aspergillus tanneri TaxID=1220188 RepID=A0A4S3J1A7_9EURO|nr:uncharacterized protein ATNIH1004_003999 [Aspergillus tanneri]KAA8648116.1 hypothetical protein ATNIH1004_003999 [Aspergillus tanneri]THC88506.1 hypothetical protein EYZ11_012048 [Aspergillus tanneri]
MEEEIQILATQKLRELLTLCGIRQSSEELLQSLVTQISGKYTSLGYLHRYKLTPTLVHKTRLETGSEETSPLPLENVSAPQTPLTPPREIRGSYRLLSHADRNDFKGLTRPARKKRKRRQKCSTIINKLSETPDSGKNEGAATTSMVFNLGEQRVAETSAATTNGTAHQDVASSASSRVDAEKPPRSEQCTQSVSSPGGADPSSTPNSKALPSLPSWLDSAYAMKTMTTILMECVRVNWTIGKCGHQTKTVNATSEPHKIRQYVDEISGYDYNRAVRVVKRDIALFAGKEMQARYNESIYWEIILKGAKLLDSATLPTAKGPADGFTVAEKVATKKFMEETGYRLGTENQRQCRNFWKSLFEMRKAGVDKILLYRTKDFDSYCKGYPKNSEVSLVDTVVKWEKVYATQIEQLENRILKLSDGDVTRRSYLDLPDVAQRLQVEGSSWNSITNKWLSNDEEAKFKLTAQPTLVLADYLGVTFDSGSISEGGRDKSDFITLQPKDESFLSVCPIIPLYKGDFLGVFAGTIRFSENFNRVHGLRGPVENLWLDYSQVTGTLNLMQVSQPGGDANVRLHWELVDEQYDSDSSMSWRVSVRATRTVMPFEEIIREASQKEQLLLHRSPVYARRGFLKS